MTNYELTYLFYEAIQVGNGTMANYMTLVFGMLVTSYLAAHRLDRGMIATLPASACCWPSAASCQTATLAGSARSPWANSLSM